jgi:hypothetical protein
MGAYRVRGTGAGLEYRWRTLFSPEESIHSGKHAPGIFPGSFWALCLWAGRELTTEEKLNRLLVVLSWPQKLQFTFRLSLRPPEIFLRVLHALRHWTCLAWHGRTNWVLHWVHGLLV